jgi:hypothetical protein
MPAHAVTLHLPETLYRRFQQRAKGSHRSLETEILDAVASAASVEGELAHELVEGAEPTPLREARQDPWSDNPALAEAVRKGWITPADQVSAEPPPRLPVTTLKELLQELDEDRADQ